MASAGDLADNNAPVAAALNVTNAAPAAVAAPDRSATAAAAEAADDSGSDVFIGGTPVTSDADEDDSDDPDVDLEALSDDTVTALPIAS